MEFLQSLPIALGISLIGGFVVTVLGKLAAKALGAEHDHHHDDDFGEGGEHGDYGQHGEPLPDAGQQAAEDR
jgi:hypothetical protein